MFVFPLTALTCQPLAHIRTHILNRKYRVKLLKEAERFAKAALGRRSLLSITTLAESMETEIEEKEELERIRNDRLRSNALSSNNPITKTAAKKDDENPLSSLLQNRRRENWLPSVLSGLTILSAFFGFWLGLELTALLAPLYTVSDQRLHDVEVRLTQFFLANGLAFLFAIASGWLLSVVLIRRSLSANSFSSIDCASHGSTATPDGAEIELTENGITSTPSSSEEKHVLEDAPLLDGEDGQYEEGERRGSMDRGSGHLEIVEGRPDLLRLIRGNAPAVHRRVLSPRTTSFVTANGSVSEGDDPSDSSRSFHSLFYRSHNPVHIVVSAPVGLTKACARACRERERERKRKLKGENGKEEEGKKRTEEMMHASKKQFASKFRELTHHVAELSVYRCSWCG